MCPVSKQDSKKLTAKQKAFCREYTKCWNGTEAAIKAGYSRKTANKTASENLTKPDIQEEIGRLSAPALKKAEVTRESLVAELSKIAFSSISHLHNTWVERKEFEHLTQDQKDCIQEIDTKVVKKETGDGEPLYVEYVRIKLYDKMRAMEILNKMLGFNEPDQVNVNENVTGFNITIKRE